MSLSLYVCICGCGVTVESVTVHGAGSVWSQMSNPHENWEVEVSFRVTGRGRVGADGLVSNCNCSGSQKTFTYTFGNNLQMSRFNNIQ